MVLFFEAGGRLDELACLRACQTWGGEGKEEKVSHGHREYAVIVPLVLYQTGRDEEPHRWREVQRTRANGAIE